MYTLSGTRLQEGTPHFRTLTVTGADAEILLVNFLSELLYLAEDENLGAERCEFSFVNGSLRARLSLLPIVGQEKEIKAVTFHNLAIRQGARGLEVMIVFDV
jgi:SHS2 domain-containing protein